MQQVAVRGVDLDGGVTGGARALRGGDELLNDRVNAVGVEFMRRGGRCCPSSFCCQCLAS